MDIDISTGQRFWLILLMMVWAEVLVGGFLVGTARADYTRRMPIWTRMAASFILVLAAYVWWSALDAAPEAHYRRLALFIMAGMALGFLGDLFMAEVIRVPFNYVLAGIGAFGLGHVAYIAGMIDFSSAAGYDDPVARWPVLIGWLLAGAGGWYMIVFRTRHRTALHLAALPYSLLLAATAGFASGLALQNSAFIFMAIGAALFLLSDLILAAQLFNNLRFRYISDVVWFTYSPGQMLIVLSVALYMMLGI